MADKKPNPEFDMFAEAHALYPGRKRFVTTEFKNLKEQHKDWKEILPMLKGAIQNQIDYRNRKAAANEFVPEHKNFCNYIDGRFFEEDMPVAPTVEQKSHVPYL